MKKSERTNSILVWLIALVLAGVSLWSTSGFLRKNDQATILAGAHDWARGERQAWSHYYQFDKTYVTYAYSAAALKLNRALNEPVDPVTLANLAVASAFWLALFVFIGRYRSRLDPLVLCAVLTAPAILLNTQYVNSSTLSSAFLLLALAALPRMGLSALCVLLAVGARADVVLLLPLLCWLVTPFPLFGKWAGKFSRRLEKGAQNVPTIGKAGSSGFQRLENGVGLPLALIGAGVAALALGRVWSDGAGTVLDPFFQWQMAAGYWVFGFGAAGLYWLAAVWGVGRRGAPRFWALPGALAVALPVLFFLPQLHAPRYFWRGAEAVLMVAVLLPGATAIRHQWLRGLLWGAALVPLVVGIQLPSLTSPQLTVSAPTVFPSGDGHYPMGAYASFLARFHDAADSPIDHNQRVWQAVKAASLEPAEHGRVRVLVTPMYGYFLLATSLDGLSVERDSLKAFADHAFYLDSRTVSRADAKFPSDRLRALLTTPAEWVSPVVDGIGVVRVGSGDPDWGAPLRLLNRLFAGDEYRIGPPDADVPTGHTVRWFAPHTFDGAEQDPATGWYYSRTASNAEGVRKAWSALPAWMSIRAFQS